MCKGSTGVGLYDLTRKSWLVLGGGGGLWVFGGKVINLRVPAGVSGPATACAHARAAVGIQHLRHKREHGLTQNQTRLGHTLLR